MSGPSDDLRAGADALFAAQRPSIGHYPEQFPDEVVLGEFAGRPGEVTTVAIRTRGGSKPLISVRDWLIKPDGGRVPMKSGFTVRAESLPRFAHLLSQAIEALAKQQLQHNHEGRRGFR